MADYPPSDDRLRHLVAQEINPHVTSWKLAFLIANSILTSREVRGELKRVAEVHAAGEHCGDRNCEHCWNATTAAEAQQPDDNPTVGYSGKGRVWCLRCPHSDDENVPVGVDLLQPYEECARCGRDVVEVARAAKEASRG